MKRLLCVVLTLACVLSFSSCNLLDKFISTEPDAKPTATTPSTNEATTPDNKPEESIPDVTTPEKEPGETTPEQAPEETTPEKAPEETVLPDQEIYFSVQVVFQSGGIHRVEETFTVKEPCTFSQLYALFVEKHFLESFTLIPYLNGELIDTNKIVYLQEGDYIYLEEYSGMPGEEPVCAHVWISGSCEKCGAVCEHNEWDANRQCLVCGAMLGVDLLQIEIYENGEYKYNANGSIETTVEDLLMAYYGYYPWDYLESNYEFYFNGVRVDGSYWITEHGILELVTRTYE